MRRSAYLLALVMSAAACRPGPAHDVRPAPLPQAHTATPQELRQRYAWVSGYTYGDALERRVLAELPFDSISLQRDVCYGSCPIYQVVLRRDLAMVYRGERFVEHTGTWHASVWLFDYGRLSYLIERLEVMAMDSSYTRDVSDAPTATLRVWPRGAARPKVVADYASSGPPELWAVMQTIDAIVARAQWTESRPD